MTQHRALSDLDVILYLQSIVRSALSEIENTPSMSDKMFNEKMRRIEALQNDISIRQRALMRSELESARANMCS